MSVTEALMKPGSFSFQFLENSSLAVRRIPQFHGIFVVTKNRLDDNTADRTAVLAQALYAGKINSRSNDMRSWGGTNLSWFLGADQQTGPGFFNAPLNKTWTTFLVDCVDSVAGVSLGARYGIPATSIPVLPMPTASFNSATRWGIDYMAAATGVEYRYTPEFKIISAGLGVGNRSAGTGVFNHTPTVILLKDVGGRDVNITGITALDLDDANDVINYVTDVVCVGSGTFGTAAVGAAQAKDFTGVTDINTARSISSQATDNPTCAALAQADLDATDNYHPVWTCKVREYAPTRLVIPGDYVYAENIEADIYDLANPTQYRGEVHFPQLVRCTAITWALEEPQGVYCIASDGSQAVTPIHDHLIWETNSPATLELGSMPRALAPMFARRTNVASSY